MSLLDSLRYHVRTLLHPGAHARDAERELRFHLDLEAAQREHDGAAPDDAEFAARRQLGNKTAVAEAVRRTAGLAWLDATRQDLSFALRGIRRAPGFALVAAITLALGVGGATAIYAVVNAVLLRPLPVVHADRVLDLELARGDPNGGAQTVTWVSVPEYVRWRDRLHTFSGIAAASPTRAVPLGPHNHTRAPWWVGELHVVHVTPVSPNYFSVAGTAPAVGHGFTALAPDDTSAKLAVLSYAYWQSAYGGDMAAIGRTIVLDGETYTISGIMPERFVFPEDTQLWIPLAPETASYATNEYTFALNVMGRLRDGVSRSQALAELRTEFASDTLGNRVLRTMHVAAPTIRDSIVGAVQTHLVIMMASVAVLLLIAAANVTNMLLVRGSARRHEIAVRLALGAGRRRVVRQLVTEALVLAAFGAGAGLGGAAILARYVVATDALNLPRHSLVSLDVPVLLASAVAALVVGLLCGIVPALSVSRDALEMTLRSESARHSAGARRRSLRNTLVIGQIAMSVVLLTGAGLLIKTFHHLMQLRPGVSAANVLTADIDLGLPDQDTVARVLAARRIADQLRALPNVTDASVSTTYPFGGAITIGPIRIPGQALLDSTNAYSLFAGIDRHYFSALHISVIRGRAFSEQDLARKDVAIVNDVLAKRYFGSIDAIGRHITVADYPTPLEIVGVVDGMRSNLSDRVIQAATFVPVAAVGAQNASLIVRVAHGDPTAMKPAVDVAVRSASPGSHPYYLAPLNALMAYLAATEHAYTMLLAGFALVALLIAAVGLYGVISYSVTQRTREIGIRIALGAAPNAVRRRVARQGVAVTLAGVGIGAAASIAATRLLRGMLFGVAPGDPTVLALVAVVLTIVALLASWLPARRAALVDPLIAIRTE